jgi:hypothetical protein
LSGKLHQIAIAIIKAHALSSKLSLDSVEQALSTVFVSLQQLKLAEERVVPIERTKPLAKPVQKLPSHGIVRITVITERAAYIGC